MATLPSPDPPPGPDPAEVARIWDETELIVWAAVGQGFEDRPEARIAFARALHSKRDELLRELLLPASYDEGWLRDSATSGLARLHRVLGGADGGAPELAAPGVT